MAIGCAERLAIDNSGCNAHVCHFVRRSNIPAVSANRRLPFLNKGENVKRNPRPWMLLITLLTCPALASAQEFPGKPIRIVAPDIGGNVDELARILAQGLGVNSGWQVFVENRASRTIPGETVAKAAPDGYTLLINGASHWLAQFMQESVPYDAIRDFAPITQIHAAPNIVVVHPALPVKSVRELVALAKARPGELNYGAVGAGSGSHLAAELFNSMAKVNIVRITYRGAGAALNDLLSGQLQIMFSPASGWSYVRSGRLRAVAITSLKPSPIFPGLPSVAESGVPGYQAVSITGAFAPAKTPVLIVRKLNQEIVRTLNTAEVRDKLAAMGSEVVGSSPEQFAAVLKSDIATTGKLISALGIKDQ
jgi:tripartite-type tricarboxylate transporter receptor subunit TctC